MPPGVSGSQLEYVLRLAYLAGFGEMLVGGWFFDTSAILYTNALYALLMLSPSTTRRVPCIRR